MNPQNIHNQYSEYSNLRFNIISLEYKDKPIYSWTANNTAKNIEFAKQLQQDHSKEIRLVILEIEPA